MKRILIALGSVLTLSIVLISATTIKSSWDIPAEYVSKKNTVPSSEYGLDDGKEIWNKECKLCHGTSGAGDGVKASKLATDCGNLTTSNFHSSLTDGGIFYLTFVKDIPDHKYDKKIADETDRWNVVNYIRTFKK